MDIEKLFRGIAVIIDDEIKTEGSSISTIRSIIENKNIPVAIYDEIPDKKVISAFGNASFIILDWDYTNNDLPDQGEDRVIIPDTLAESQESDLISFIKSLMETIFIPVFIFTFKNPDSVKEKLGEANLWSADKPNRIFVKQKNEVSSDAELFAAIEDWLKAMPSVYVLKEWESILSTTKNNMFLEMYKYSPNWSKIIWDMLKDDSRENHREFGDFVTRNLLNRIDGYTFDDTLIDTEQEISTVELSKVVEGERFISYGNQPQQAYTGDLFLIEGTYFLNIRAQCDLARKSNPELYLIKGKELSDEDIVTEDIRLTNHNELLISADKRFSLEQLGEICRNDARLIEINSLFRKCRNDAFFVGGNIIGKKSEIIITCIAGKKALKFRHDLIIKKFNEVKDSRIGRVLPPYITCIQQSCAQYIVRKGTMPTPRELFSTFDE